MKKGSVHFETSVSECVDVLQTQLRKTREKNIDRRKGNEDKIQDVLIAGEDDETETELEDVVK